MSFSTVVHRQISLLGEDEWSCFAQASCYQSYHWLKRLEISNHSYYITVYSHSGSAVAVMPCYYLLTSSATFRTYDIEYLLHGNLAKDEISRLSENDDIGASTTLQIIPPKSRVVLFPTLLCAIRNGYESLPIYRQHTQATDIDAINHMIVRRLLELRMELDCRSLSVLYVSELHPFAKLLSEMEWLAIDLEAEAKLSLPGHSFDDYLSVFSGKRRGKFRREMKRFEQSGSEIEITELSKGLLPRLAVLLQNIETKYQGVQEKPERFMQYLSGLEQMPFRNHLFLAKKSGEIVSFSLFYEFGDVLYGRMAGFDYEKIDDDFCYFNIAFYRPIIYAYEHGIHEINYGLGSLSTKVRRGCHLVPRRGFVYCPELHTDAQWLSWANVLNGAKRSYYESLITEYGSHMDDSTAN